MDLSSIGLGSYCDDVSDRCVYIVGWESIHNGNVVMSGQSNHVFVDKYIAEKAMQVQMKLLLEWRDKLVHSSEHATSSHDAKSQDTKSQDATSFHTVWGHEKQFVTGSVWIETKNVNYFGKEAIPCLMELMQQPSLMD